MTAKDQFIEASYDKLKAAVMDIPQNERGDIYALSFWFYTDEDDPRYPKIAVSYNTNSQFESEQGGASSKEEARWNYAYWLQEDIGEIGGEEDELLSAWFRESPHYYTGEQDEAAAEDDALFRQLLEQGDRFDQEFIEIVIALTQRLFSDNIITETFGRNLPVLVHELEYYDEPVDWTIRANPAGVADEFVAAYRAGKL